MIYWIVSESFGINYSLYCLSVQIDRGIIELSKAVPYFPLPINFGGSEGGCIIVFSSNAS